MAAGPADPARGRWILAIVVGIGLTLAGGYAFVRAAQLDDRSAWQPRRATVASRGMAMRDSGTFGVTWIDDAGTAHEGRVETSKDEARAIVEHLGGTEIDVQVFERDQRVVVCPTSGFDTCVEHGKDLKGGYLGMGAGLALVLYALFRLRTVKSPAQ